MSGRLAWGFLACLIGPLCLGCSSSQGIVRGQNPAPEASGVYHGDRGSVTRFNERMSRPYYTEISTYAGPGGQETARHYTMWGTNPNPQGGYGLLHGHLGHHHAGPIEPNPCEDAWYPTHKHTFTSFPPQNLVYPQQNTPAPVVQYPYYTVKGPDDFFHN